MSGDRCRWRAICHAKAVGRVVADYPGRKKNTPLAIGRYCGEHLALFNLLHPDASRARFVVEYDQPQEP